MSDTIAVTIKPLKKNEVELTPEMVKIARGDAKGTEYPIVFPKTIMLDDGKTLDPAATMQSLSNFINWRGLKQVVKILLGAEKQDGQAALEFAGTFSESQTVDEDGKPVTIKRLTSVDADKYYEAYLSDTMRGGESIASMEVEFKDTVGLMQAKFQEKINPSNQTPDKQKAIDAELIELSMSIQSLQQAIDARRRPKSAPQPVAA